MFYLFCIQHDRTPQLKDRSMNETQTFFMTNKQKESFNITFKLIFLNFLIRNSFASYFLIIKFVFPDPSCGHKGPVLRPRRVGPGKARTQMLLSDPSCSKMGKNFIGTLTGFRTLLH